MSVFYECKNFGISGVSAKNRHEFQRLIGDCEAGKIDIILTKSISRFARNTVDLIKTVRCLKELNIDVRFEKERINSLSSDRKLMLTILASFVHEESRSISENVKWSIRKKMSQGIPNGQFRLYGYEWIDNELSIIPAEAEIIQRIYSEYLSRRSPRDIAKDLNADGINTRAGFQWCDSIIRDFLSNITYTGNLLLQRTYTTYPITK